MKKKVLNGVLAMALLVPATSAFVSCKDTNGDDLADVRSATQKQIADLKATIDALQAKLDQMKSCDCDPNAIERLQISIAGLEAALETLKGEVATKADALEVADRLQALQDQIDALNAALADKVTVEQLNQAIADAIANKADKSEIVELYNQLANLVTAQQHADDLAQLKAELEAMIAAIKPGTGEVSLADFEALKEEVRLLGEKVAATEAELKEELSKKVDSEVFENAIGDIRSELALVNTTLAGKVSQEDFDTYVTATAATFELLGEEVEDLKEGKLDIATFEAFVNAFSEKVDAVLANLVLGVNLEATYSPVLGYYKEVLTGATSKVIGAYYGRSTEAVEFPTADADFIANGVSVSEAELGDAKTSVIKAGTLFNEVKGNAGKVFFTLDTYAPSFSTEGIKAHLETSLGKTNSGVELTGIRPAEQELGFGYTRTSGQNYVATATIKEENLAALSLNQRLSVPENFLSNVKNDIKNKKMKSLAIDVAQAAFENNNGLDSNFPAYALVVGNGAKTVTSKFDLLTVAVHPLSYTVFDNVNISRVPGIGRAEALVERLINSVRNKINDTFSNTLNRLGKIVANSDGSYTIYDKDGNFLTDLNPEADGWTEKATREFKHLQEIYGDKINLIIDDLNSAINRYNNFAGSSVINYIERLNDRVIGYINNADLLLQPIVLFQENGSYRRAIGATVGSTTSVKETKLVVTSPTAELIAPAYKRFIAVFDADGKQIFNSGVVDGNVSSFDVTLSKGVNKIVYEAVDYSGKIVAVKSYINVK